MHTAKPAGIPGHKSADTSERIPAEATSAQLRSKRDSAKSTGAPVLPGRGKAFGYARVSRGDHQQLDRQLTELSHCDRVFTDEVSGGKATADRPGFSALLSHLRAGDIVEAVSLDRLSRSLTDLIGTLDRLTEAGVTVRIHGLGDFDPRSPMTRLLYQVLGAVAELERALIRERTLSGLAEARRRGAKIGRPKALDDLGIRTAKSMRQSGASVADIARALGISERTVRRALADSEEDR